MPQGLLAWSLGCFLFFTIGEKRKIRDGGTQDRVRKKRPESDLILRLARSGDSLRVPDNDILAAGEME